MCRIQLKQNKIFRHFGKHQLHWLVYSYFYYVRFYDIECSIFCRLISWATESYWNRMRYSRRLRLWNNYCPVIQCRLCTKIFLTPGALYRSRNILPLMVHTLINDNENMKLNMSIRKLNKTLCKSKVKSSMARSLPEENLLPQNVGSIINYSQ